MCPPSGLIGLTSSETSLHWVTEYPSSTSLFWKDLRHKIQVRTISTLENPWQTSEYAEKCAPNGPIMRFNGSWQDYKTGVFKQVVCKDMLIDETSKQFKQCNRTFQTISYHFFDISAHLSRWAKSIFYIQISKRSNLSHSYKLCFLAIRSRYLSLAKFIFKQYTKAGNKLNSSINHIM